MRPLGFVWAIVTLLLAAAVGVGAYQLGLHDGLSEQIRNLPANTVPAPGYGYPYYYGPHFGFWFFPFFPIFGFLFLLLILFAAFRPRRWRGHGPGGHLDEWHRRAHEAGAPADSPRQ